MSEEIWKQVQRFPDYAAGNFGHIKRIVAKKHVPAGHQVKPQRMVIGYHKITLYRDGSRIEQLLHTIILETFMGSAPPGYNCNHKDGIKTNNCLSNLEWVTPAENVHHAHDILGHFGGPSPKITLEQVQEIRSRYALGEKQKSLALEFGIDQSHVSRIVHGLRRSS